jgi:GAF domain-containing protein
VHPLFSGTPHSYYDDMSAVQRELELANIFVLLADTVRSDYEVMSAMGHLADACTQFTDAVDVGVLLANDAGVLRIVASTNERASDVEEAQLGSGDGPCLESFQGNRVVEVRDIVDVRDRWPDFAAQASESGYRAARSVPLEVHGHVVGTLNLFAAKPGPLLDQDIALVSSFVRVATISIVQQRAFDAQKTVAEQLQGALDSRVIVEQAKGVLAEQRATEVGDAFQIMRKYARDNGLRLKDIAHRVVQRELYL